MNARLLIPLLLLAGCQRCNDAPATATPATPTPKKQPTVDVSRLPRSEGLPDPFLLADGARVESTADWTRRRAEMITLLERWQYGRMPPAPGNVQVKELSSEEVFGGRAMKKLLTLTMGPPQQLRASVGIYVPTGAGRRMPVMLHIDHRKVFGISAARELIERGYMVVGYDPTYLAPDRPNATGPAQAAYPEYDWGTLAVWAWGAMRVADYLVTRPDVDAGKLVVVGHSRSGKAALWAGARDERFALVAPAGSGCGGAAAHRVKDPRAESLTQLAKNFPHWFHPRLRAFAGREPHLPFDQHFVLALVAPRALVSLDALGDAWANLPGTHQAHLAAREVYDFLGASQKIGVHFRAGKHDISREDWSTLADFSDQVLRGKAGSRDWRKAPFSSKPAHTWTRPEPVSTIHR